MTTRITVSRGGEEIRALRRRVGLTQDDFAGLLGTHPDTLSAWERGKYEPPLMAVRLARYLLMGLPPRSAFLPAPTLPSVQLSPSCRCYWYRNDQVPCGGRQYHVQAYLSRRRNVESEVCEAHLNTAFEDMVTTLEEAAKAEQRRQAGRRRKQEARRKARERIAASAATASTL